MEFRRLGPTESVAASAELRAVYAAVFSQPPYDEGPEMADTFVGWLAAESQRPGFELVAASVGGELVGFCYGYRRVPGQWWSGADGPPPAEVAEVDHFAVMEWAVLPSHQGKGIGRRLLEELLAPRDEPYASLGVRSDAAARAVYLRWGWRQVGSIVRDGAPPYEIMWRATRG